MKFRAWHLLPFFWVTLVAFLVYRDVKERTSPPQNSVIDVGSQPASNVPIASPVAPSSSIPASPAIERRPETAERAVTSDPSPEGAVTFQGPEQEPNEPEPSSGTEVASDQENDPAQTLAGFYELLRQDPDNMDAKFKIAEILTHDKWDANAEEKAEAEKFYTDLLQLYPDHPDLRNGLATLYVQTNRVDEAIQLWSSPPEEQALPPP